MPKPIITIENLQKSYIVGGQEVQILKDISFEIATGDFMIIFGPSGCGKSTLLHSILGLEEPSKGKVTFLGQDLYDNFTEDDRSEFRKMHIGMVYQQPNWVKSLSVIENVAFPLLLLGYEKQNAMSQARVLLKTIEMENWANYVPTELSSGQQQRIALIRALITNPQIIIADEPTGNLDYESGQKLMELLTYYNQKEQKTIVTVTHDLEYLKFSKTAVKILDGKVVQIYKNIEEIEKQVKYKRGDSEKKLKILDQTDKSEKTLVETIK